MSDKTWTRVPLAALIGLVVGLAIGGGGAGYLWFTHQQELADAQAEQDQLKAAADQALEQHEKALSAAMQEATDLQVRVELSRALDELDRRNFGTAKDALEAAKTAAGKASAEVQEAAKGLANIDLEVTDDTGAQRDAIAATARAVDGALD